MCFWVPHIPAKFGAFDFDFVFHSHFLIYHFVVISGRRLQISRSSFSESSGQTGPHLAKTVIDA